MPRETIARYEIRSELGRGGMAVVYLAYDPNFRRNVAIKLVSGSLQENSVYRDRFEREAHLIARIEHPAIVPVYDYGEHGNELYLVMRYMPGGSLADKLRQGVLTLGYATQVISQIVPALDAVHSQGIVHRDLKPGNILFDSFGNPAISDFGIAHFTTATSDLTGSAVIGTPSYMSPEQVRADADLDGRSDIYALGVILFEMLTGRGPFQASTPMSVALKHLTDPLPSIRSLRPDLPAELQPILSNALAKDRNLRIASAAELASALRAIPGATAIEPEHHAKVRVAARRNDEKSTEVDMGDEMGGPGSHSDPQPVPFSNASASNSVQPSRVQKPSRLLQMAAIAAIALLLFFVCGSLGVFGTWAGLSGLFSPGSPTISPTTARTAQEVILFSDDFTDPTSGWPAGQDASSEYGYQSNGYRIFAIGNGSIPWVSIDLVREDVSIHVDAAPVSGDGFYGVLCRIQNERNFYYFAFGNNGNYDIGRLINGEFQTLFLDGVRYSEVIRQGNQPNHMQADCQGSTLRLYANDVFLAEVTDTTFRSGAVGMSAGSLAEQGFGVYFDNFSVTAIGQ